MRAIFCFAALGFAFAHHGDDEIAVARSATAAAMRCVIAIDRLAFAVELRAFRIGDRRRVLARDAARSRMPASTLDDILRLTARMPGAEQVLARIGERARHENALCASAAAGSHRS